MFRAGLRMIIEADLPDADVFEAGSLDEVLRGSNNIPTVAFTPDIVLLDLNLPDASGLSVQNGLNCLMLLRCKWPKIPVLVLSSQDDQETVCSVFERGVSGFVSKAETAKGIVEAILRALSCHPLPARTSRAAAPQQQLTPRQSEVLNLLSQGLSNKLIARHLDISENTVRVHVQTLLKLFQVTNRAGAAFAARQQKLLN